MSSAAAAAGVLGWMEATQVSQAMRYGLWLYPIVEIFHILGLSILFGSIAVFDLRLLGVLRVVPVYALGRQLLPWSVASLLLILPSGLLLFSAHPHEFLANRIFLLKLGLIAAAGFNALWFHRVAYRSARNWNAGDKPPIPARLHALVSLAIWASVIACGRLLAYT